MRVITVDVFYTVPRRRRAVTPILTSDGCTCRSPICGCTRDEFKESEHPRSPDGEFTSAGGASKHAVSVKAAPKRAKDNLVAHQPGKEMPPHIKKLKIPPAWKDIHYAMDPDAPLQVIGRDTKGREQRVYNSAFSHTQAEAKFRRIQELDRKFGEVLLQNAEAQKSHNAKVRAAADCAHLIMQMGVRPGSETDTGAKVKAYGATTLEGKHVVQTPTGVRLQFTGKKGVALDLHVPDEATAHMLLARKRAAGEDGQLFDINDKVLLDHVHSFDGGGFKTKDFLTLLATRTAMAEVARIEKPANEKEYKKAVLEVAKKVSAKLGNTPVVALQSYINPVVFAPWQYKESE